MAKKSTHQRSLTWNNHKARTPGSRAKRKKAKKIPSGQQKTKEKVKVR
jgi:hypothetical protein